MNTTLDIPVGWKLCPSCKGAGEHVVQRRFCTGSHGVLVIDPQDDIQVTCGRCRGEGVIKK